MYIENIDIDEQLAILWSKVYASIIYIIDNHFGREQKVVLTCNDSADAIVVTYDGVIKLLSNDGFLEDAEQFDDYVLYDVYRELMVSVSAMPPCTHSFIIISLLPNQNI